MKKVILLLVSHSVILAGGLGLGTAFGIYLLPILTADPPPSQADLAPSRVGDVLFSAEIKHDARGTDFLHWGTGRFSITESHIIYEGTLAPGPDYQVYLVPQMVEHEDDFLPIKDSSVSLGDVRGFNGFVLEIPEGLSISDYAAILIWCETFEEFVAVAQVN